MRRDVERAELGEVFRAKTEREDVRIQRFLNSAESAGRGKIIGDLGVAQISLDVEVAEGLSTVETEAIEVGIVVDLDARANGVAVRLTDVKGDAQRTAAGSRVVKAQNGTVDVGFIAGTVAVEALGFVGRAEDIHPGGKAFRALRGSAAADGGRHLIVHIQSGRESTAEDSHIAADDFGFSNVTVLDSPICLVLSRGFIRRIDLGSFGDLLPFSFSVVVIGIKRFVAVDKGIGEEVAGVRHFLDVVLNEPGIVHAEILELIKLFLISGQRNCRFRHLNLVEIGIGNDILLIRHRHIGAKIKRVCARLFILDESISSQIREEDRAGNRAVTRSHTLEHAGSFRIVVLRSDRTHVEHNVRTSSCRQRALGG